MADIIIGTKLLNSGLGHHPSTLGAQWQVLKQVGLDDAAAWDAIRNYSVLEEQDHLNRLKNEPEPRSDIAFYTGFRKKQAAAIAAREERLAMLLNLQNPYRAPGAQQVEA